MCNLSMVPRTLLMVVLLCVELGACVNAKLSAAGGNSTTGGSPGGSDAAVAPGADDDVVLGIDLGTTRSCMSYYDPKKGASEVVPVDSGLRVMPSYVSFVGAQPVAGKAARAQAKRYPTRVVYDAKRLIGRSFSSPMVQKDMESFPFSVIDRDGHPVVSIVGKDGQAKTYAPEYISAMILQKLKRDASARLGRKVTKAVITVPAYFNGPQRQATRDAATIAGLEVVALVAEPVAAALSFAADRLTGKQSRTILVFDMGGGTFDVSVLRFGRNETRTLAVGGDSHLGGRDVDTILERHFMKMLSTEHGINVRNQPKMLARLQGTVEEAKIVLSEAMEAEVELSGVLPDGEDFVATLSRTDFDRMCDPIFQRAIQAVEKVLKDAKLSVDDVDDVLLVGGSSRIPRLRWLVSQLFGGKVLSHQANPDEAVALGASAYHQWSLNRDVDIVSVNPLPVSASTHPDEHTCLLAPLIRANTPLPAEATQNSTTLFDYQTNAHMRFFQGFGVHCEDPDVVELGDYVLRGIEIAKKGIPQFQTAARLDESGILHVSSKDLRSGAEMSGSFSSSSAMLSLSRVKELRAEVEAKESFLEKKRKLAIALSEKLPRARTKRSPELHRKVQALRKALHKADQESDLDRVATSINELHAKLPLHGEL